MCFHCDAKKEDYANISAVLAGIPRQDTRDSFVSECCKRPVSSLAFLTGGAYHMMV